MLNIDIPSLSRTYTEIRMAADMCMDLIMETDRGDDGILRGEWNSFTWLVLCLFS